MRHRLPALLLLAACGHAAPAVRPPAATAPVAHGLPSGSPLAAPGERMTYRLSLEGIDLASFAMVFGEVTDVDGKRAIVVQSNAKASSLVAALGQAIDDHFTSWVDVGNGRPLLFRVDEASTKKKGTIEHAEARVAACANQTVPVTYAEDTAPPAPEPQRLVRCDDVWDLNTFLIALRGWEGTPGATVETEVLRSRYLWRAQVTIHGKESRVTEIGELPTLRIDGLLHKLDRDGTAFKDAEDRHFSLWVSDDADRVPVALVARTDYGDIKMEITEYQPGTARLTAATTP